MHWNWTEPKPEDVLLSQILMYYEYWKYEYWTLISWTHCLQGKKKNHVLFCFLAEVSLPWSEKVGLSCHAKSWALHYQRIWLMLWGLTKMIYLLGRSYYCQIFSFVTQLHGNWYIIAVEVEGFNDLVTNSFSLPDHMLTLYWFLIRMFNTVYSFYSI